MLKKIAIGVVAMVLLGAAYAYIAYGSVARAGTGYAAKNLCSGYYLSGFAPEDVQDQALRGASELLSQVSYAIDEEDQRVSTSLYGLFERHAIFTQGIGCTLLPSGEEDAEMPVTALPALAISGEEAWPLGSATPDVTGEFDALLEEAFVEEDPERPRYTKAIVVAHQGRIVAEKYAEGVSSDTPLIGWSMTKSVTALTAGLLVKDGVLDVAAPAAVPQWQEQADDPRAAITLDQLLRMSSGLAFQETYSAATDVTQMLSNENDAGGFAASMPLDGPPDTIWSYSSGTTNIISGIIRRSLGDTLQGAYDYSQERLFRPLNIRTATIETDRNGTFIGSSYMYASARDWARLGQFCLQDGVWNGERLLPEGWVEYLVTPTETAEANLYGAQVWLNQDPTDPGQKRLFPSLPTDAYYMGGYQGQIVLVIPSQDLVITRFGFTPGENTGVEEMAAKIIAQLGDRDQV